MAKPIFQDIIPKEKRSIRNISLPAQSTREEKKIDIRERRKEIENEIFKTEKEVLSHPNDAYKKTKNSTPKIGVWFLAIISFFALIFSGAYFFSKAQVEVTTKKFDIKLDDDVTATSDPTKDLPYSTITLSDDGNKEINGSGQKEVSTNAVGSIIIYNNQTTAQKIIRDTRVESPAGLIFKVDNTITVPAKKIVSGKTVPGSIEVKIHADKPGSKYNVGLTDFTLPAFKGGPKFDSVYGKSKTAIDGGNFGKVAVVASDDINKTREEVHLDITKKILANAALQVPDNFILLPGAYKIDFTSSDPELSADKANIKEKAVLKAYIFDKNKLATALGKIKKMSIASDIPISVDTSKIIASNLSEATDTLKFHLTGNLPVEYILDTEALKKDLKGKNNAEAIKVFESYQSIEKGKVASTPIFWKVPNSISKINVKIN